MPVIDYKAYIEHHFYIKNKKGILEPFTLNDVQLWYLELLEADYPDMQGIRENILKGRQFGISSLITGIFATDFIMSELGEVPIVDSDVYSHKDEETTAHINRFNLFLDSFMFKSQGGTALDIENNEEGRIAMRKQFLKVDNGGEIVGRKRGSQYHAQTASAKVSGRGGTKQNIHWTEPAFYPNTEIMNAKKLMVGAEKQVPQNYGKIIRETTGNMMGDYFSEEYQDGKEGKSIYKSRFIAWYQHKEYANEAPQDWTIPDYYTKLLTEGLATPDQCYWHYKQTRELQDKEELREYPTYDYEAFLMTGSVLFDPDALIHYQNAIMKPIKEVEYVQAL